jgi:signal transduction histidine kinase/DNA-binding response OmpR family regulator/ligand-binding sensor domain-containing protein
MLKTVLKNCIAVLFPLFAWSQKADFRLYTTADGLPQNWTHRVAQDTQGFLWVNAIGKLVRFDGNQFLTSANSKSPVFRANRQHISEISIKGSHLIFIENGQFTKVNTLTGEETSLPLSKYLPSSADTLSAQCIKIDDQHVVICSGPESSGIVYILWLENGEIGKLTTFSGVNTSKDFFMRTVAGDGQGHVFFINKALDDVLVFDKNGKKLRNTNAFIFSAGLSILVQAHDSAPLLVTNQKIFRWNPQRQAFEPHPINRFTQSFKFALDNVLATPDGNIWASANSRNLFFYNAKQDRFHSYQTDLEKIIPHAVSLGILYQDKENNIWVVCTDGLLKVTPQVELFHNYFTEENQNCGGYCSFRGSAEDGEGNVYASFYNNIFKINKDGSTDGRPILPSSGNVPYDLFYDKGKLLLNDGRVLDLAKNTLGNPYNCYMNSTDGGLYAKDANGKIWRLKADDFFELDEAKSPPQWAKMKDLPGQNFSSDIVYDRHNQQLWFFADYDLCTLDPVERTLTNWSKSAPKIGSTRNCLYPDGKGVLWIGTEHGLWYFNYEKKTKKIYTQKDGLPNEIIVGLLPEGDSCLWISTFNGLSRLSIASGRFLNFFKEDGLADNEFNRVSFFKASDGRMFFGGVKGVTAFYPEAVMAGFSDKNPNVRLLLRSVTMTEDGADSILVRAFNDPAQPLDIFARNRIVTLDFGVYGNEKSNQALYSYKLDGLHETWSPPSKNTSVTFSSLPAGHYFFRLKALDARGNWLAQEIALPFIVHPPWWATWWAYLLYALLLMAAAYAVFLFLKKRWELQNQLQNEQREALRLKELDAFKSRLYTNITHEFRTPLTVILGMAEELEVGSQEQGRIAKTLGLVKRNGQNLLRLVNQLLDLSKLEDKSFKLRLQFGDIVPFLRYVTESFQSYANSQNLSLRFVSTMEKLEMDFDPEQVQQVLTNLIGNAIKFTPSGGEISVGMRDEGLGMRGQGSGMRDEGSGMNPRRSSSLIPHPSSLIISVSDTGIGISAAELPHIFDRFYQVDGSTTQAGEGTGIGLAHTLELVKLMQGKIEVESELGKGTKFTIQLPVVHLPGTQPLTSPQPPDPLKREPKPLISAELGRVDISSDSTVSGSPFRGSGGSHEGNNLLLIEDNADVVVYLKSILSEKYHVSVAYNGRIGIEMALENVPDLIVSDVMMPEKDGYQVLDTLKNDQLTSHIPIILLTAKADAASKVAGLKRGADAYLSKPFDKKELLATLEMMLENRRRMVAFFASQMAVPSEGIAIEDAFIQKVRKIVAENFADENFALPQLCDQLNMSRSQLFRKMKALTDTSPSDFIRDFRMQQARTLLESRQFSVKEVAYKVGFKDISHFSKSFQEAFGVSPSLLAK